MKPIRPFFLLLLLLGLLGASELMAQAGSGNLYRVTSKIEIDGMPFPMPSRAAEVCGPKNQASDKMVPRDENCTVSNFREHGNKSSFDMTCRGENPMTATGEFERLGPDAYRGRMQMKGEMEGEPMDMTMNFEGKKIRDCNYASESPEAKGRAVLAETCEQMLRNPGFASFQVFTGPKASCPTYKQRYCDAMQSASMKPDFIRGNDPQNLPAGMPTLWDAFQACGTPRSVVLNKTCPMAEKSRDFAFIAGYCPSLLVKACTMADPAKDSEFVIRSCPVQAQAIAAQHCAGRGYTALRSSPYANFCAQQAAGNLQQRNARGEGGRAGAEPEHAPEATEEPEKKSSWRDRLKRAADKLSVDN